MNMPPFDEHALAQSGFEALQRGSARKARESFDKIAAAGKADSSTFLALAYACLSLKEQPASLAAIDKALALDARNLRALIFKADYLAEAERGLVRGMIEAIDAGGGSMQASDA
jgi:hypothetical protein